MLRAKNFVIALMLSALIFLACASTVPQQAVITLNQAVTYQTMLGWEATAQAGQWEFKNIFPKYKDFVFDSAINDLGLNRVRLEIQNGSENPVDYFTPFYNGLIPRSEWRKHWYEIINDNNDPNVINPAGFQFAVIDQTIDTVILPLKQRLETRGEKLYVNLNNVDFGPSAFEHKDYPEEYAEYMLATFLHLRDKYGWTPDSIEIVLEADNARWSGTQLGQAIVAAGDRLKAHGFHPNFVAPAAASMANAITLFDELIQVPRVTEYFSELSYHRYGGVSDANLQSIGSRTTQYGIQSSHLELIGANFLDLHKDLALGRVSSWAQFVLAGPLSNGPDNGGRYYVIDDRDPNNPVAQIGRRTKFLRQYFKYVRRGAVRIQATSSDQGLEPLAFVNADCKQTVIVKAGSATNFSIQGLPTGTYGVKYTTDSQYDFDNPDVTIGAGQALQTSIPDYGVITIYTKSSTCSPLVNLSAASYRGAEMAPESLVAVFGKDLANSTVIASTTPLPTTLDGTTVKVKDSKGVERLAPLFFVSTYQINYEIPAGTSPGPAVVTVNRSNEIAALSALSVARAAPGLFAADGTGQGVAAAVALRVKADNTQTYEPISQYIPALRRHVPIPIDLGPDLGAASDQVFLVLFGTGIRHNSGPSWLKAKIGDLDSPLVAAAPVAAFAGLDQVNVQLPRSLAGKGEANVLLTVDGKPANLVTVNIK
ncbi:MAG: hypothetical protein AB7U82_01270 [Blastocatellales bacterium]